MRYIVYTQKLTTKNNRAMADKTFTEIWRDMTSTEREDLAITISKKCNISIYTTRAYGSGARTPRISTQQEIAKLLKVEHTKLFPNNDTTVS